MTARARCALGAVLAFVTAGCGVQRAVLYPAPVARRAPRFEGGSLVKLPSPSGDVVAIYVAAPVREPTIAYFHGNGEDLAGVEDLAAKLRAEGLGVYAIEYPGYGIAGGEPTEPSLCAAAEQALVHLHRELGVKPTDVVLMGRSLGTGVAVEMSVRGHGARMVLISPYTSIDDLAHRYTGLPGSWLVEDHFDSAAKAPGVALPVLIVAGTNDTLVPAWMAGALSTRFPDAAVLWVRGGHHNDLFARAGGDIVRTLGAFARLGRARRQ